MKTNKNTQKVLNNFLKRFRWALSVLPGEEQKEIVQETRSHLLERLESSENLDVFIEVIDEFKTPEEYAEGFIQESEDAVAEKGRFSKQKLSLRLRQLRRWTINFLSNIGVVSFYIFSIVLILGGILKFFIPKYVGFWFPAKFTPFIFGLNFSQNPESERLGYWIIPISFILGIALFFLTHKYSRKWVITIPEITSRIYSKVFIGLSILSAIAVILFGNGIVVVTPDSGKYILEENSTLKGVLLILKDGEAILEENTTLDGMIIMNEGSLEIKNNVEVSGELYLYCSEVILGENSIVHNVFLNGGHLEVFPRGYIEGEVFAPSGHLEIHSGGAVIGNIFMVSGELELNPNADVNGDVVLVAADLKLSSMSLIWGDVITTRGQLTLESDSTIQGELFYQAGRNDVFKERSDMAHIIGGEHPLTPLERITIFPRLIVPVFQFLTMHLLIRVVLILVVLLIAFAIWKRQRRINVKLNTSKL